MQRLLIFSTVLILEGQFQTIMSHETRQPTTVIEFETPYNAAWSGRHRNDVEIQQSITNAIQAIAADKIKHWEDTRSVAVGSLPAQVVNTHGYERIGEILNIARGKEYTKTKNIIGKGSSFNWQGEGTARIKVSSFAEVAPK